MNALPPSLGTELKLNVNAELGNNLHLADVDFFAVFYVIGQERTLKVKKKNMVRVDDDNYIAVVDSSKIGTGEYWMQLTVYLSDADCIDGERTEVVDVPTGVKVK